MSNQEKTLEQLEEELTKALERIRELDDLKCACVLNEEKVRQQNEFLSHVIESLPHPFYVLDANDYSIKLANSASGFGELSSLTTCYALTHRRNSPCEGDEHACPLQIVKRTKKPVILEHIHFDKDQNPRCVEVHASPILDQNGEVVQMIEYSLDITERKEIEQELRNYAEKIKFFAYSISHDIKSPMIGINGLTKLLHKQYRNALDEKAQRYCDQIVKASEQVLSLIEEINAYIKAKEWPLSFEMIDPGEVLETVRREFETLITNRGVRWVRIESIPNIKADRMSLLRVFRNLVDNAIKYGGNDLSEIAIGYEASEKFHIFSVQDNGVGIRKEDCEKVFGVFERNQSAKGVDGTGLGLAIVKEIAERHHGRAWVKSEAGFGATFFVSLSKDL